MTSEYRKPVPTPSPETLPYWQAARKHELKLPYCLGCSSFFWFPRPFCPKCFSWEIDWRTVSGKGRLYTYAIQYRPQMPGFETELPYITAIVELEEGPRLMTNLVDAEPDPGAIRCDMPVVVVFIDVSDEVTLPKFRPAGGAR